jgi:prepilin-type N-terminal cleavage/methylation domain-containing protein
MDMPTRDRRRGFTLIELLIVIAIIVVLISAAAPRFSQYLMNAREVAAMGAIRTIHTAQTQYSSQFGRFAATLAELGPPTSGQEGPSAANLIQADLATGIKGGFKYVVEATPTGYKVVATPVMFNRDGRRSFYSDQSMLLRENWGADPATLTSPAAQ